MRKRLQKEIELGPDEIDNLSAKFVHLFRDPRSDCQPTKPWENLAAKTEAALSKRRLVDVTTDDPWVVMLLNEYKNRDLPKLTEAALHPFGKKEEACSAYTQSIVALHTVVNTPTRTALSFKIKRNKPVLVPSAS